MATKYFVGKKAATTQIQTTEVTAAPGGSTFTITIGGIVATAAAGASLTLTASNIVTACKSIDHPYFNAITFSSSGAVVTLTAKTAGVPFVYTSGTSGGGVTDATVAAGTGPNYWNEALNWSDGSLPGVADTVILADNKTDICWGLAGNTAKLLALRIEASYSGRIGLDYTVFATSANARVVDRSVPDYRQHALVVAAAAAGTLEIGKKVSGDERGSDRIIISYVDAANTPDETYVYSAPASADAGRPAVRLVLFDGILYVNSTVGGVGVADEKPDETAFVDSMIVFPSLSNGSGLNVTGRGALIFAFTSYAGQTLIRGLATLSSMSSCTVRGGGVVVEGIGYITTVSIYDGVLELNNKNTSSNDVTTFNFYGGTLDLTKRQKAIAIKTLNLRTVESQGRIMAKAGFLTYTTFSVSGKFLITHRGS